MKRSTNLAWSELKVGMILVGSVLIGTVSIVSFSGIREYFRPTFPIHTHMDKVAGLKPGAIVMLSGVHIGNVKSLELGGSGGVRIDMSIYTRNQDDLHSDSLATLGSQGLLGDKYIELSSGSFSRPPLQPDAQIASGDDPSDLSEVIDQAKGTSKKLDLLLADLTQISEKLRSGQGTAGKLLRDDSLYDSAKGAADAAADTAKAITGSADELKDAVGKIAAAADTYKALGQRLENDLLKPDGTLKKLATDPAPFTHLNSALGKLDTVLGKLDEGDGSLAKMLNNGDVADELTGLIKDLRELVQQIKKDPKGNLKITVF